MGPISMSALATKIFENLTQVDEFKYDLDELQEFYSKTKNNKLTPPKARSSAFQAFRSAHKGIDKDQLPKWADIKNNPDEFAKYQSIAENTNNQRGFTDENPKISKKKKNDERKNALKAAISAAQKKQTHISDDDSKSEALPEQSEVDIQSPLEEEKTSVKNDTFDKIDENHDGVISREEFEKFTQNSESDEENNNSEEESKEEEQTLDKPKYTGKAAHTPLSNFKQWVLKQKNLEFNSSVKKTEMDEYRQEYNFDPKNYDEEVPWYNFININMTLE